MAKPIITLNGLKIVIMLGMLVIILCGIRFAAEIIVPFILALFIAVILNPLVQHMVRWRVPRVLAVSILMTIIVMAMVLLLAYLGSALNELTRMKRRTKNAKTFHDKCEKFNFRASNETAALTAVFLFIKWDHFG